MSKYQRDIEKIKNYIENETVAYYEQRRSDLLEIQQLTGLPFRTCDCGIDTLHTAHYCPLCGFDFIAGAFARYDLFAHSRYPDAWELLGGDDLAINYLESLLPIATNDYLAQIRAGEPIQKLSFEHWLELKRIEKINTENWYPLWCDYWQYEIGGFKHRPMKKERYGYYQQEPYYIWDGLSDGFTLTGFLPHGKSSIPIGYHTDDFQQFDGAHSVLVYTERWDYD
jgi:hypothetical protein